LELALHSQELRAQSLDLASAVTRVTAGGPHERRSRVPQTLPQILFPQTQRKDLDRATRVRRRLVLGRYRA
jgi:hypothetical protein